MGVEVNKVKKLELEIQKLKDLVLQLQSQVIMLQARDTTILMPPITVPPIQTTPSIPVPTTWSPFGPFIGDTPPMWQGTQKPTIICGEVISGNSTNSANNTQVSRCIK